MVLIYVGITNGNFSFSKMTKRPPIAFNSYAKEGPRIYSKASIVPDSEFFSPAHGLSRIIRTGRGRALGCEFLSNPEKR